MPRRFAEHLHRLPGTFSNRPWIDTRSTLDEPLCVSDGNLSGSQKTKKFQLHGQRFQRKPGAPQRPPRAPQDPKDLSGSPQGMPNGPARCSPGAPRAPRVWKGGQPGPPPEELLQSSGPHREKISSPQKKTDPGVYVKPKEFVFTDTKTLRCIRKIQGIPKEFVYTDTKKH